MAPLRSTPPSLYVERDGLGESPMTAQAKKTLVTLFVSQKEGPSAMLNVNMDKHPHGINERRIVCLKAEGGV